MILADATDEKNQGDGEGEPGNETFLRKHLGLPFRGEMSVGSVST